MNNYWWDRLAKEILNTPLNTRSGTCVGASSGVLALVEKDGDYLVKKVKEGDIPQEAFLSCPDRYNNIPELNQFIFGKLPNSWLFGEVKRYYLGHAADLVVRSLGASAGILTATLLYLLENKLIDGAIVLKMRKDKPYLTEPLIATSREEIIQAAQSKYTIAPVNQILSQLPGQYQSLAYVGLPDQVMAIRKLQQLNHPSVSKINYVFGPFCGSVLRFSAIKSFLRTHGVKDVSQIKSLEFRAGEWPGYFKIELKNGRIISVRKFHANYLIPFHITDYSLYQVDQANELTDISVGDAWAPIYEQRGKGWSLALARSTKGLRLIERMITEKVLTLEEVDLTHALSMQSHSIDFKKRGAFIRINRLKKQGRPYPEYGYEPINIPASRVRFEYFLDLLFKICSWPIVLHLVEKFPVELTGRVFMWARNIWKKSTKKVKRGGLTDLKFKITEPDNR